MGYIWGMGEDPVVVLRHNILGQLTVIKNALSFVLEGNTGQITDETKKFLQEAYKRNEELIEKLIATRKEDSLWNVIQNQACVHTD